jgi:hypothetical protein
MKIHKGTSTVKKAKMYVLKGKFSEFAMKKDESVLKMFNRLNDIVNEFKGLGLRCRMWISLTSFLGLFRKDMTPL